MTDQISVKSKPRQPWLAVLLTLITPGLGHIYSGKLFRGLIFVCIYGISIPLILALMAILSPEQTIVHMLMLYLLSLAICIIALIDSCALARSTKTEYQLKEYNCPGIYLFIILIASGSFLGNALYVRGQYAEAFVVPSVSMYPSIIPGDRILINKTITRIQDPQRGDLVVFINPEDRSQRYIKRVVALAGDTVERKAGRLIINDSPLPRQPVPDSILSSIPQEVDGRLLIGDLYYETNGPAQYKINLAPPDSESLSSLDHAPITIPPHHCFVLGDNRNDSYDSRHFGPIPLATIIGRADCLYLPAQNLARFGKIE